MMKVQQLQTTLDDAAAETMVVKKFKSNHIKSRQNQWYLLLWDSAG